MTLSGYFRSLILAAAVAASALPADAEAKYVFYFIGDGMGIGHVSTAETYNRTVLHSDKPLLMLTFPVASQARTYSASSPITDSAAAGTALSAGIKTNNAMVGMSPDTLDVESIAARFMRSGRAVGVLTSVAGDDATPAAFYAHAPERGMKERISGYAPQSGITFLGAARFRGMTDSNGKPTDWLERMKKAGYTLVHNEKEYQSLNGKASKVLMLSDTPVGDQIGYTLDYTGTGLTLQEMTRTGLQAVSSDPDGFFMMIEGGNIDWAAHANDGASVIKEVLNFQNAIDVAYRFYEQHPDETLIVITADHDTGGMALGRQDNQKNPNLALIDVQKISKDSFAAWCRDNWTAKAPTWDEMQSFLTERLGLWREIMPTADEEKEIRKGFDDTFVNHSAKDEKTLYNDFNRFTVIVYDVLNRHYGIGWTTGNHTANFVPVYAIGEGAELFTGNLNNIEIPERIARAAGVN